MSGGPPGTPHHVDYFFHDTEEDMIHAAGSRAYDLPEYHKKSLKQIESKLKSGEVDKHELHEFSHFLEHLSHQIREVLGQEKAEGISNLELEKHLRKIAALLNMIASKDHE
ncbi:MAG: hypothetical protein V1859_04735 [archaeon]